MKSGMLTAIAIVLLLALLASAVCMGTRREDLIKTAVVETLTTIAATETASVTPTTTPSPKVALVSFHGRYVTALGVGGGWWTVDGWW